MKDTFFYKYKIKAFKLYPLFLNFGFTLIELLIVMGIMALLAGIGIANYQNFNRNQILNQAAQNLRSNLRDTQNRALSGEKDCSVGVCGGTTAGCGNDTDGSEKPLDGWCVDFFANSYQIYGVCGGTCATGTFFNSKTVSTNDVLITPPLPPNDPILFKSLTHGTSVSGSTNITLSFFGNTQTITVYDSGEIK